MSLPAACWPAAAITKACTSYRSQGRRRGPAGKHDAGDNFLPEPVPPVRKAGRHDWYGDDRSRGFHQIYKLDVVAVPPNRPFNRTDRTDRIYKNEAGKFKAIIKEVKVLHTKGQPVLIGSASIEKNEKLGELLDKAKIPHQILNAKTTSVKRQLSPKPARRVP
jgi:hypothetical protein